ncbi:PLAC8-domain-containing protein [Viridothelium virens]|uniref:PLAC8-domain-containing protein n=1 Tax=Viridothelium virens TaxID=1048519 RepID=A0A6A6H5E2_VIRVR|nr:PLAC8-domain-containing protein [Viridothelium virens]
MADAPFPAFTPDERFPKYPAFPTEDESPSGTSHPQLPSSDSEKQALSSLPASNSAISPMTSTDLSTASKSLPPISTVSPWNYASPPQYAVDTPATEPAASAGLPPPAPAFPVAMNGERQDSLLTPTVGQPPRSQRGLEMGGLVGAEGGEGRADGYWRHSFWEFWGEGSGLCCDVIWCPCVVGGRTHQRWKGVAPERVGSFSGYCFVCPLLALICCGQWIPMMVGRRDIRHKYRIPGSGCLDCMAVTACPWCALVQEEREVSMREGEVENEKLRRQYERRDEGMVYTPGGRA